MPRTNASTSTLRNRNRVTNKTRLKVFHGSIDADPLLLEEEEASNILKLNTQGVDAEDANVSLVVFLLVSPPTPFKKPSALVVLTWQVRHTFRGKLTKHPSFGIQEHHLQAVLSAATQRHQTGSQRLTRGADKASAPSAVFIPVPDSTGVVDDYQDLYPPNRWKDPVTYIRSSETADECCANALSNGFTYYVDERDSEWLDKNNEEARGEGTSAQGAISAAGTTTRSGPSRSAKAKGKEPEVLPPTAISLDEFELVMGLFERVTHEKTEYLHHVGAFIGFLLFLH